MPFKVLVLPGSIRNHACDLAFGDPLHVRPNKHKRCDQRNQNSLSSIDFRDLRLEQERQKRHHQALQITR